MARHCMWSSTTKLTMVFRSKGDATQIIDEKEKNRIIKEQPDFIKNIFECNAISAFDLINKYKFTDRTGDTLDLNSDFLSNTK